MRGDAICYGFVSASAPWVCLSNQEVRLELSSQRTVLQGIMEGLRMKYPSSFPLVPTEVQKPLQDVTHLLEELEEKVHAPATLCHL